MNRPASALRYVTTYLVLMHEFALDRGWRFWRMLAAVLASAFIHPIPFLLIAEILRNAQVKASEVVLGWRGLSLSLQPDVAVLAVFLIGSGSFLFSYGVGRLVSREIIAWQGAMFWRIMSGVGELARWDRTLELGTILQPYSLAARFDIALRGAFPIGRLIETGSRDFVMILTLGALLIWQDAGDTAVLAFLSLLFLPAYAMALARLVKMQSKSNAQLGKMLQPVTGLLSSDVTRRPGRRLDAEAVPAAVTTLLSQGFGSQSLLLNEQNAVSVVAGIHVFAAFYGVFLSEGRSLTALPASKLSFLFFVVLLLRSLTGLIGLVSRLSRGYERLGQLRALLHPMTKSASIVGQSEPGRFDFCDRGQDGPARSLGPGDCIVFLAPDISFGFQLLPVSNALTPRFQTQPGMVKHIPLLGPDDMAALLAGGVIEGERQSLRLPITGALPLRPVPVDLANAPAVALTRPAWQRLVSDGTLAAAGKSRLLVLAAPGQAVPAAAPANAFFALSDGRRLIGSGDAAAMAEKLRADAGKRAGSRIEPDEEEEEGIGEV